MNRRVFLAAATMAPAEGKIRTAFLGTRHSHFGGKLKAVAANPAFEVAGICEPDEAARRRLRLPYAWLSEDQLLGDASIRLVVVEMPPATGVPFALQAIAAGKHVHIEKPPSAGMPHFRELVETARGKNLLLQVGYIWRYHEGVRKAIEAARKGWLGEVYLMRGAIHTDISQAAREELAAFRGGMMFELGCHQIDRAVALFGRPRNVRSWLKRTASGKDGLADNTLAVLEYDSALAVITASARMPGHSWHRSFEVIGTEGAFVLQPVEPGTRMRVSMRAARGEYRAGWQDVELPAQARYVGDFAELARAIRTSTPLEYSYDFELLVQETILRASQEI
ncbi:MAG: Inositol 2-dehydrogenase/D-chiro-inositol 3-dehydrogenase [Bryobacteraceae bacterium]|nr:Inositol 2-dehydrogenase/D-chiro-inositol 3-dehydrogenase [Bryobacteraceae bacterium]